MGKDLQEKEVLQELYDLGNAELFINIMNYYGEVKTIRNRMVDSLELLDKFDETGAEEDKQRLRKEILDNFNDLPRETRHFIKEMSKILKE